MSQSPRVELCYQFLVVKRANATNTLTKYGHFHEQDKSSDIEQQLPFGDRKYSNTLPQKKGNTKPTGTSYNLDKV